MKRRGTVGMTLLAVVVGLTVGGPRAHAQFPGSGGSLSEEPNGLLRGLPLDLGQGTRQSVREVIELSAGAVDPATYRLGPEDELGLEVAGALSLSASKPVGADGAVTFPQLGTFFVAGMTLADAKSLIKKRATRMIRGATIDITLNRMRVFKVYVVGEVAATGVYRANAVTRVSEVVGAAGGTQPGADSRNIELIHADGTRERADLAGYYLTGNPEGNLTVRDGTVVAVAPRTATLEFAGAFVRPGVFDYREGDDLAAWLARVTPRFDAQSTVVVHNPAQPGPARTLTLESVRSGSERVTLQPFDRILLRFSGEVPAEAFAEVRGAVLFPGPVPVRRGELRLSNLLDQAGGFAEDAVPQRVVVSRVVPADTINATSLSPDRARLAAITASSRRESVHNAADPADDPLIEPGDIVTVTRSGGFVQLTGQIKHPGLYDYVEGWTYRDYVRAAGGFAQQADKSQTRVTRQAPGQVMFANDAGALAPGDLVWVPEKPKGNFWQVMRDISGLTSTAVTLFLVVREAYR